MGRKPRAAQDCHQSLFSSPFIFRHRRFLLLPYELSRALKDICYIFFIHPHSIWSPFYQKYKSLKYFLTDFVLPSAESISLLLAFHFPYFYFWSEQQVCLLIIKSCIVSFLNSILVFFFGYLGSEMAELFIT